MLTPELEAQTQQQLNQAMQVVYQLINCYQQGDQAGWAQRLQHQLPACLQALEAGATAGTTSQSVWNKHLQLLPFLSFSERGFHYMQSLSMELLQTQAMIPIMATTDTHYPLGGY